MNKKRWIMMFLLVGLVFTLLACGNSQPDSKQSAGNSSNASESANNEVEQQTEESSVLDEIKSRGHLSMAMGGKYPPFNFINENNELDGFDVDIGKEIAKRLGVEAKPVTTEWDGIIPGLIAGKYDIVLGSLAITEERKQKVDFVHYYTSGAAIIVPEDSDISGAEELAGVTVGVGLGTTYEAKAIELGADVKTYSASVDAFTDMINGRVQAVISDKLLTLYGIQEKGYPFKLIGETLFDELCGIAIRKEDKDLQEEIARIVDEMKADGTYTEISEKWFGTDIR